jgi:hypothetical protein
MTLNIRKTLDEISVSATGKNGDEECATVYGNSSIDELRNLAAKLNRTVEILESLERYDTFETGITF